MGGSTQIFFFNNKDDTFPSHPTTITDNDHVLVLTTFQLHTMGLHCPAILLKEQVQVVNFLLCTIGVQLAIQQFFLPNYAKGFD